MMHECKKVDVAAKKALAAAQSPPADMLMSPAGL